MVIYTLGPVENNDIIRIMCMVIIKCMIPHCIATIATVIVKLETATLI